MINIVVAYDEQGAIGKNNDLPWGRSLPNDLRHFKSLTMGQRVIMGRKTFESIGKPLPGRENIIISTQEISVPGAKKFGSLAVALAFDRSSEQETFIIGGSQLYESALGYVDRIYATEVHHTFEGADTFFPPTGPEWVETERTDFEADEKNAYDYSFVTYDRHKNTPQT
jgi:dihydrofolate reductase